MSVWFLEAFSGCTPCYWLVPRVQHTCCSSRHWQLKEMNCSCGKAGSTRIQSYDLLQIFLCASLLNTLFFCTPVLFKWTPSDTFCNERRKHHRALTVLKAPEKHEENSVKCISSTPNHCINKQVLTQSIMCVFFSPSSPPRWDCYLFTLAHLLGWFSLLLLQVCVYECGSFSLSICPSL